MKDKKGAVETAGMAAIVIVCVILAAFVFSWTVSLVDTDPASPGEEGYARSFVNEPGTVHTAWIAQRMTFSEDVEVVSVLANLGLWPGGEPGMCTVHAQLQVTNAVGGGASVRFKSQTFDPIGASMQYFGTTLNGEPAPLVAGTYYLAIRADCAEPGQAERFIWYFCFDDIVVDPTVVLIRHCADFNEDGYWNPTSGLECQVPVVSFILEGTVGWADEEPPDEANETVEPPPLVDSLTGMNYEDYDWVMYAILGGVIIIVLVVIVVAVRW